MAWSCRQRMRKIVWLRSRRAREPALDHSLVQLLEPDPAPNLLKTFFAAAVNTAEPLWQPTSRRFLATQVWTPIGGSRTDLPNQAQAGFRTAGNSTSTRPRRKPARSTWTLRAPPMLRRDSFDSSFRSGGRSICSRTADRYDAFCICPAMLAMPDSAIRSPGEA